MEGSASLLTPLHKDYEVFCTEFPRGKKASLVKLSILPHLDRFVNYLPTPATVFDDCTEIRLFFFASPDFLTMIEWIAPSWNPVLAVETLDPRATDRILTSLNIPRLREVAQLTHTIAGILSVVSFFTLTLIFWTIATKTIVSFRFRVTAKFVESAHAPHSEILLLPFQRFRIRITQVYLVEVYHQ